MKSTGAACEDFALAHLAGAGLRLAARNWRCRFGELDLVMRDGEIVVFVEVRYRRGAAFGGAAASVDAGKRARLAHAAESFLSSHPELSRAPCRFDVVALAGNPAAPNIEWHRNAFEPCRG